MMVQTVVETMIVLMEEGQEESVFFMPLWVPVAESQEA